MWGELGTVHLFGKRNRLKVWGLWCRVMMEMYVEISWRVALCKGVPGCGQLEEGWLGSPHGSRLSCLPWLTSCGLFRLYHGAWGDVPTIPTTTKRSYHHSAILKHQYHNNEYNVDNNNYNNNFKKCSFWYTYTRKIYFFFSLQQKWHSPTLRSGIHQHLSTNSLWLSPTTLTSRLRIYGYCGYPTAR